MSEAGSTLEKARPKIWAIDTIKAKLLECSNGKVPQSAEFPAFILLNDTWQGLLEEIFYVSETAHGGNTTFFYEHPEENARIVKTDARKTAVLVQRRNQKGGTTLVKVDTSSVKYPEVLLGILHKHPAEVLFSTEDILPLVLTGGHFIEGVVTPSNYYLAFRSSDTTNLGNFQVFARGYILGMAKAHRQTVSRHPSSGMDNATMTRGMFNELKIPLYEGKRGKRTLNLVVQPGRISLTFGFIFQHFASRKHSFKISQFRFSWMSSVWV